MDNKTIDAGIAVHPDKKVVLVTGATGGIGSATVRRLLSCGHTVFAAGRKRSSLEPLEQAGAVPLICDVTKEDDCIAAIAYVIEQVGRIDCIVNNAGYGSFGAIEDVPLEEARYQFEVNVFGLAALTRAALPYMRDAGKGTIINISSVAGRAVFAYFGGWYHATKYAVEALSDALRIEAEPFGIKVVLIEPGAVASSWSGIATDHLKRTSKGGAYETQAHLVSKALERIYAQSSVTSPDRIAQAIVKACEASQPRARSVVGFGARPILIARALIPTRLFDALLRKVVVLGKEQ